MIVPRLRAFLRSFLLQSLWNFERMQNAGFAFAMDPLLRAVCKTKSVYYLALRRHLGFFNAHPFLAPVVLGVMAEREKAFTEQPSASAERTLVVLKDSMGGAFGAIGDHVFWGTWRPFCALLAMTAGLVVAYPLEQDGSGHSLFYDPAARACAAWWVGGFLGLFNALNLWLRWRGLSRGYALGPQVVRWIQSLRLQPWAALIRRLGILLVAGTLLAYLARWRSSDMLLWMIGVFLGTVTLKRWAAGGVVLFYLVLGVSFVMTKLDILWP